MARKDFDDFDKFAKDYRQIHDECVRFSGADSDHFSEQKVAEIRRQETGSEVEILDLGCGDGNSANFFRRYFPDCKYTGLDTSKESIARASSRSIDGCTFSAYDGIVVPFPDDSFDVVFVACVLHHVSRMMHEKLIGEARRVLKAGGRLYIFEHNPFNPLTRYVVRTCPFDEDAVLLSPSYLRRLLRASGFLQIAIKYTLFIPPHKIFRVFLNLEKHLSWLPLGGQYYSISRK